MKKQRTTSFLITCCSAAVLTWLPSSASLGDEKPTSYPGYHEMDMSRSGEDTTADDVEELVDTAPVIQSLKMNLVYDPGTYSSTNDAIDDLKRLKEKRISLRSISRLRIDAALTVLNAMGSNMQLFDQLHIENSKAKTEMFNYFERVSEQTGYDPSLYAHATSNFFLANKYTYGTPELKNRLGTFYLPFSQIFFKYLTSKPKQPMDNGRIGMTDFIVGYFATTPNWGSEPSNSLDEVFKLTDDRGYFKSEELISLSDKTLFSTLNALRVVPEMTDVLKRMPNNVRKTLLVRLASTKPSDKDGETKILVAFHALTMGLNEDEIKKLLPRDTFENLTQRINTEILKQSSTAADMSGTREEAHKKIEFWGALVASSLAPDDDRKKKILTKMIQKCSYQLKDDDFVPLPELVNIYHNLSPNLTQHANKMIEKLPEDSRVKLTRILKPVQDIGIVQPEQTKK